MRKRQRQVHLGWSQIKRVASEDKRVQLLEAGRHVQQQRVWGAGQHEDPAEGEGAESEKPRRGASQNHMKAPRSQL